MPTPSDLPPSTVTDEDRKRLAALAHVLGCQPNLAREVLRARNAERDMHVRVEELEQSVRSLTLLVVEKGK